MQPISQTRWTTIALMAVILAVTSPSARAQAEATLKLQACTPLPIPTNMHGCTVARGRLYVLGGNTSAGYQSTVFSAPIISPGNLGTWRAEAPLPENRSYIQTSVVTVNDTIYVLGGSNPATDGENSLTRTRDVLWSKVGPDGGLAGWNRQQVDRDVSLACAVVCTVENAIFFVGGQSGEISNNVYRSELQPDGTPGPFTLVAAMPEPRWFHGGAINGDRLYVWGGLSGTKNSTVVPEVYSAPLTSDKKLGPWRQETNLPSPMYSAAYCGANNYLVSAGGRYINAYPTNAIWYTYLENGSPKQWHLVKSDLKAMVYHSLALDKASSTVYIVGGQMKKGAGGPQEENILDNVQAFQLPR